MPDFRYIPSDEIARRHRARNSGSPSRQTIPSIPAGPQYRNVEEVLSLGDVRFITFRGRVFRIPPVPFKMGQRVLNSQIRVMQHAKHVAATGNADSANEFYAELAVLARLLWQHIRPIGKVRRFFWRIGLLRNPFRSASEAEVKAITDFFLQGRMTSSVRLTSAKEISL